MLKWLVLSSCFFSSVFAACPITHAYLTYAFFDHFPKYSKAEEYEFMAGTLFPDIRHSSGTDREATHYDVMTLEEVLQEENPFIAGIKFHSYVDLVREELVVQEGLYEILKPQVPHQYWTFLKLAEDEILYAKRGWGEVAIALNTIYPEVTQLYGFGDGTVRHWHRMLTFLFSHSPLGAINVLVFIGRGALGASLEQIKAWKPLLVSFCQEEFLQNWVTTLTTHFEAKFEEYRLLRDNPTVENRRHLACF